MNILNTIGYFIVQVVAGALTFVGIQTPINPTLNVTLGALPTTINAGEVAKLSWSSNGAVECTSIDFSTGSQVVGNKDVSPTQTTTYNILCFDAKSTALATPGTWQLSDTDYTDFACPVSTVELDLGNGVTEPIPECAGSVPKQNCTVNQNGGCNWSNSFEPSGTACSGTGQCKVSSSSQSCVVKTKIYSCTPTPVTTGTWTLVGSDLSDIFIFPGGDPSKNQIYRGMQDCPVPDPEGKSCTSANRCKTNKTVGWLVYTDIYACQGGGTAPKPQNLNAVSSQVTVTVNQAVTPPGGGGGGSGQCSDKKDNDNDGKVDSADFGCSIGTGNESPNPQCSDGIDNNNNGLIDLKDTGACTSSTDNNERFPDGAATLSADTLVLKNTSARISWSISNVVAGSCVLKGTNGDTWTLTGNSGTVTSSPLANETQFTLTCTDLNARSIKQSVTVKIAPTFDEQ